jgi:NADH pyrophosphatase NudC (nudix superfamily)
VLIRHRTASFGYGLYGMIGGNVQQGEALLRAIKRKVFEEVGLNISKEAFVLSHMFHCKIEKEEFIIACFKADISKLQQPCNKQSDKHDDVQFFSINQLPKNISPAHKQIIECIENGILYSEHGWE